MDTNRVVADPPRSRGQEQSIVSSLLTQLRTSCKPPGAPPSHEEDRRGNLDARRKLRRATTRCRCFALGNTKPTRTTHAAEGAKMLSSTPDSPWGDVIPVAIQAPLLDHVQQCHRELRCGRWGDSCCTFHVHRSLKQAASTSKNNNSQQQQQQVGIDMEAKRKDGQCVCCKDGNMYGSK